MPEKLAQALYDREAKTETPASVAGRIVELVVFLEDRLVLSFGNPDPGVPNLDAQMPRTALVIRTAQLFRTAQWTPNHRIPFT